MHAPALSRPGWARPSSPAPSIHARADERTSAPQRAPPRRTRPSPRALASPIPCAAANRHRQLSHVLSGLTLSAAASVINVAVSAGDRRQLRRQVAHERPAPRRPLHGRVRPASERLSRPLRGAGERAWDSDDPGGRALAGWEPPEPEKTVEARMGPRLPPSVEGSFSSPDATGGAASGSILGGFAGRRDVGQDRVQSRSDKPRPARRGGAGSPLRGARPDAARRVCGLVPGPRGHLGWGT